MIIVFIWTGCSCPFFYLFPILLCNFISPSNTPNFRVIWNADIKLAPKASCASILYFSVTENGLMSELKIQDLCWFKSKAFCTPVPLGNPQVKHKRHLLLMYSSNWFQVVRCLHQKRHITVSWVVLSILQCRPCQETHNKKYYNSILLM